MNAFPDDSKSLLAAGHLFLAHANVCEMTEVIYG